MKNGIEYITCDRLGCNQLVGAKRYEEGKVVEEEYVPDACQVEDRFFCCQECADNEEVFIEPEDWQDGDLEEVE